MQAIVTVDTYFYADNGAVQARYMPGDIVSDDMAETAIAGGWAEPKPEPASEKTPEPPADKKPAKDG
jgi:hypothetical protein